ncbi:GNAT family N-acetyltransferase [Reinekea marina]|uniref:GNAT family N-acetyltransferase n=2 Tax=Reinekea marina TaxID=1310421 RepID=A0ABV7WPQ8_9GAMM
MPDMIVPLKNLPPIPALPDGYTLDIAKPWDSQTIVEWVDANFLPEWSNEVLCGLSGHPAKVSLITKNNSIVGFAGFDLTFPSFFGPTGVLESERGLGLGKILLVDAMHRLMQRGYVYAFIGSPGPVNFYQKILGGMLLPESFPDGYSTPITPNQSM